MSMEHIKKQQNNEKKLVHSSGIHKTRYRKSSYYLIIIISY